MIKLTTDKTAKAGSFSYKYLSLERLLEILDKNKIQIIQYSKTDEHNLQDYSSTGCRKGLYIC